MKCYMLFITILSIGVIYPQNNVLVEVFTNSHCSVCPNAHQALEQYVSSSVSSEHVHFLFYHMHYPYADDSLHLQNTADPRARSLYYGNFFSTPVVFFNGAYQANTYALWPGVLEQYMSSSPKVAITLHLQKEAGHYLLNANITALQAIPADSLRLHIVLAENVRYAGRNGITRHIQVVRKMLTTPAGEPFTLSGSTQMVQKTFTLESYINPDSISIVAFLQANPGKQILQSSYVKGGTLGAFKEKPQIPSRLMLEQNYPNPFNPVTTIRFSLPGTEYAKLTLYSPMGERLETLFEGTAHAGAHAIQWNASAYSSGTYFYTLTTKDFTQTRKMVLLK